MVNGRRGAALVEFLVAFFISLLLVDLSLRAVVAARAAQRSMQSRAERLTTLRVARTVLRTELRAGLAGRDWRARSPSVVELRSFLGQGAVCGGTSPPGSLVVSWRGRRAPDPARDSVLALGASGRWEAGRLLARGGTAPCPGSSTAGEVWTTTLANGTPPLALLVYTSGDYHLSGGALRYRRGRAGRQPLTPTVLAPASAFLSSGRRLRVQLEGRTGWKWNGGLAYGLAP